MKNNSYEDIINLPHPVSKNHPQMPLRDRAAQFAPFAALTGHDAAIKETARLTDERLELSEEVIAQLNEKINIIRNNIGIEQNVSITYFIPDAKKAGGSYVVCSGVVHLESGNSAFEQSADFLITHRAHSGLGEDFRSRSGTVGLEHLGSLVEVLNHPGP